MYLRKNILGLSKCPTFVNSSLRSVVIASQAGLPTPNNSMDRMSCSGFVECAPGRKHPNVLFFLLSRLHVLYTMVAPEYPAGVLYPHFPPSFCFCKDEMSQGAPCDHQVPGPH